MEVAEGGKSKAKSKDKKKKESKAKKSGSKKEVLCLFYILYIIYFGNFITTYI